MIDKFQEYDQAWLNIAMSAKIRIPADIYEGYFEEDLLKLKELLDELKKLPNEVNYTSENDIFRLRAFIKEELRRNKLLELMIKEAINNFRKNNICPLDEPGYHNDMCDGRNCNECWMFYLKDKIEGEMPFK